MEWTEIVGAALATAVLVVGIAKIWVKFTATSKDDEIVAKIEEAINKLSPKE